MENDETNLKLDKKNFAQIDLVALIVRSFWWNAKGLSKSIFLWMVLIPDYAYSCIIAFIVLACLMLRILISFSTCFNISQTNVLLIRMHSLLHQFFLCT